MRRNGEAREQLLRVLPAVLGSELEAAAIRDNIGYTQWLADRWPQAIRSVQRATHDQERLLGPRNSSTLQGQSTLIAIEMDAGDYRAALSSYQDLADRAAQLDGRNKTAELMNRSYGIPVLVWTDPLAQAEAVGRDTLRIAEADAAFQPFVLRLFKRRLALALLINGKGAEALSVLQTLSTPEVADNHPRHGLTLLYLAGALAAEGRAAEAATAAHDAADLLGKDPLFINQVWSAKARLTEALARARLGDAGRAGAVAAEGAALFAKTLPAGHANFELAKLAQAAALEAAGGREPPHGAYRDTQRFTDLDLAQAAEAAHLDHLDQPLVDLREFFEGVVQAQQLLVVQRRRLGDAGVQRHLRLLAAAPLSMALAHEVDHDETHHAGGVTEEAARVVERHAVVLRQPQPGFMDEAGGIEQRDQLVAPQLRVQRAEQRVVRKAAFGVCHAVGPPTSILPPNMLLEHHPPMIDRCTP